MIHYSMAGRVIWRDILRVGASYFHELQPIENIFHKWNIILHDQPLNDVFILYLLNIQKNNRSKLKNERMNKANETKKRASNESTSH